MPTTADEIAFEPALIFEKSFGIIDVLIREKT
jgi:hypothetical protein